MEFEDIVRRQPAREHGPDRMDVPFCLRVEFYVSREGLDAGVLERKQAIADPACQLDRRGDRRPSPASERRDGSGPRVLPARG